MSMVLRDEGSLEPCDLSIYKAKTLRRWKASLGHHQDLHRLGSPLGRPLGYKLEAQALDGSFPALWHQGVTPSAYASTWPQAGAAPGVSAHL